MSNPNPTPKDDEDPPIIIIIGKAVREFAADYPRVTVAALAFLVGLIVGVLL